MKKLFLTILAATIAAAVLFGCTRGYESQKSVGDLKITLTVDRYPLVKGDNALAVKVADAADKPVTDASVNVRYFMPPMAGMAPMEYQTQATLKGNAYSFSANVAMEGGWKVEVSVARPGKPVAAAMFNIEAR